MSRWVGVAVVVMILALLAGGVVTYISRLRATADMVRCQNNLRELALFAGRFADPKPGAPALVNEIPAGTIFNASLPPEERLSWFVTALPWLDQRRMNVEELLRKIDRSEAWSRGPNETAARMKMVVLLCPAMPPEIVPNQPAPTNYFGTAGLGVDAATLRVERINLRLGAFGTWPVWKVSPRAGSFRYDTPTPFEAIADGISQTILLGEREPDTGPWLRGGPSTVRGYDVAANAPPPIGAGGQFGGGHPYAANFAFADGSVRPIAPNVDPKILMSRLTIAGGEGGAEWLAD